MLLLLGYFYTFTAVTSTYRPRQDTPCRPRCNPRPINTRTDHNTSGSQPRPVIPWNPLLVATNSTKSCIVRCGQHSVYPHNTLLVLAYPIVDLAFEGISTIVPDLSVIPRILLKPGQQQASGDYASLLAGALDEGVSYERSHLSL